VRLDADAVVAAKNSVKNAKDNKPTNKPPTTTFKTSKTSKTTTSSTSSTSCVNLGGGDDSLPIETPPEEKRSISEETGEIHSDWKRQSPRDTTICKGWTVPLYESWHAPPKSNAYTKFYDSTYRLNMASCTDVKFDLYEKSTGRARKDYATEHVYELQMIKQFLAYMWLNDEGIKAWRARPENVAITDFCELYNGFLYVDAGDTPWWDTSADLGFPDDLLESVVGELSSGARDEMVYLESYMVSSSRRPELICQQES
jgi:hypothetical protein